MIVYKLVTRRSDGRLISLMERGEREVEYRVGEYSHPRKGVLYAFDCPEGARPWMSGPEVEMWLAEATGVTPTPYANIVGCQGLKLLEKVSTASSSDGL